jgi:hypothetical protein
MKMISRIVVVFILILEGFSAAQAQTTNFALGAPSLLVGPAAGSNSVVLAVTPVTVPWTAVANDSWLHLSASNQNGTGSTNVIFSYDANPGTTRSGTLTIGGLTLTVTQAGSTYIAAEPLTTLAEAVAFTNIMGDLVIPDSLGVAVDNAGNVYFVWTAIMKWDPASNVVSSLASNLLGSELALDGAGNVYVADTLNAAIQEWTATNNTVTTVVTNVMYPDGLALDRSGNIYINSTYSLSILKWTKRLNTVATLVPSVEDEYGLGVDMAGNVYFPTLGVNAENNSLEEWNAANSNVTTLVSSGLNNPVSAAVDGAGNVYVADEFIGAIEEWNVASNSLTTNVSSGLSYPTGVAVDSAGNLYISAYNEIKELPHAFVDPTPRIENGNPGADVLPPVLPLTANLLPPFAPTSDQPWLTIDGVSNGVVSFSFSANPGPGGRLGYITLLGQPVPVVQVFLGPPDTLTVIPYQNNGTIKFAFGDTRNSPFSVVSATDLTLPFGNWSVVGAASNIAPGLFQFTSLETNLGQFYRVRSP